jgi:hypothetical protein
MRADCGLLGLACFVRSSLRLFTPCLLECGNKSYSHIIALLDRYKGVFQALCTTTVKKKTAAAEGAAEEPPQPLSAFDCQRLIVHSLSEYWQHSAQHLIVLSEQLYLHSIVSMPSLIAWCFFAQRHPERHTHLWKDILIAILRRCLTDLQAKQDAVLHKPRAMQMTAERRAEDARTLEALLLERRELLVSCVSNFQRLLAELQKRDVSKEREKARMETDQSNLMQRFIQFAREVSAEQYTNLKEVGRGCCDVSWTHVWPFSFHAHALLLVPRRVVGLFVVSARGGSEILAAV